MMYWPIFCAVVLMNPNSKQNQSLVKRARTLKKKRSKENRIVRLTDRGRFAPDRLMANLIYNDPSINRTNASSNAMNWAYRSSAYDPDPLLGTGAIPGFVELANMYEQYLVRRITLNLKIGNQNTQNCQIGIWPSNVIQSNNSLTASEILEYSSNPGSIRDLIPVSNGGVVRYNMQAIGTKLFGRQFLTDENFAGSTSGNPTLMYGINIGICDGTGANFAFPVVLIASLTYQTEFFGLRQLES